MHHSNMKQQKNWQKRVWVEYIDWNLIWNKLWSFFPWFTGHSSYRHKRDLSDEIQDTLTRGLDVVRDEISGSNGTEEVCGAAGVKIPARCNEISECKCEGLGACTCVPSLSPVFYPSFVLLIVVMISNFLNRCY